MKLLITGTNGFVGKSLCPELCNQGHAVLAAMRSLDKQVVDVDKVLITSISKETDWCSALQNVEVVIHLAARVHVMNEVAVDALAEFHKVNVEGTLNLARQAAKCGVQRFIFLSSIGVNGNNNLKPFTDGDTQNPQNPYAVSKYEAEQGLLAIAKETGMEVVIIRPPLVYGPGVKANFASMMKWVNKNIPLPFGAIHNQRSLVALDNLVDFIIHCIDHPKAANEVFLISDGEDVSTTELLQKVAKAFGKKALLLSVPVSLMTLSAKLLGKGDVANRLFGSLQVDSSKARELLGWEPVITMDEQLNKTADAYLAKKKD
jgi:nucleoside-diphosphate-sugar epimerase